MYKVKKNPSFQEIIKGFDFRIQKLPQNTLKVLHQGLFVYKEFIVLKYLYDEKYDSSLWKGDLTSLECHFNKFFVDQRLGNKSLDLQSRFSFSIKEKLLSKTICACDELYSILSKYRQLLSEEEKIRVIISIDQFDPEIYSDPEEDYEISSAVRFHKIREGEFWLDNNIENYHEPIMYIDFDLESLPKISDQWWK